MGSGNLPFRYYHLRHEPFGCHINKNVTFFQLYLRLFPNECQLIWLFRCLLAWHKGNRHRRFYSSASFRICLGQFTLLIFFSPNSVASSGKESAPKPVRAIGKYCGIAGWQDGQISTLFWKKKTANEVILYGYLPKKGLFSVHRHTYCSIHLL